MDLKTFVKETLTQIAEGVNEAKPIVAKTNCFIIDRQPSSLECQTAFVRITTTTQLPGLILI